MGLDFNDLSTSHESLLDLDSGDSGFSSSDAGRGEHFPECCLVYRAVGEIGFGKDLGGTPGDNRLPNRPDIFRGCAWNGPAAGTESRLGSTVGGQQLPK